MILLKTWHIFIVFGLVLIPNIACSSQDDMFSYLKAEHPEMIDGIVSLITDIPGTGGMGFVEALNKTFATIEKEYFSQETSLVTELRTCIRDFTQVSIDSIKGEFYALQLLDSWGKQESGFLEGNVRWPGDFYECLEAKNDIISGKYCESHFLYRLLGLRGIPTEITWGTCFPSECSNAAVHIISAVYFKNSSPSLPPLVYVECNEPRISNIDTSAIVAICISSVLLALVVIATVRDLLVRHKIIEEEQNSRFHVKMLMCFSMRTNINNVLKIERKKGSLEVLDGMRFLSTTWIILYHCYYISSFFLDNGVYFNRYIHENLGFFMPTISGAIAVDTFFFIGGLLVAYLGMKQILKNKGSINIPKLYLHRYLRLTPAYAFVILVITGLYKYFGYGPYWVNAVRSTQGTCTETWWTCLLYISNIYPVGNGCVGWCWYLAADMQMYLTTPFFILLLHKNGNLGVSVLMSCIVASMTFVGVTSSLYNLMPSTLYLIQEQSYWYRFYINTTNYTPPTVGQVLSYDTYFTPWCRFMTYGIGFLTGYLLFVTKRKLKMHWGLALTGWIVTAVSCISMVYGLYGYMKTRENMNTHLAAFYSAMARPVYALCMAWVVCACNFGYGGPVKDFLNWKVFTPLSSLTYSTYLVHYVVLQWYIGVQDRSFHFLMVNLVFMYLGCLVISFGVGLLVCLLVEWPFTRLTKLLFSLMDKPRSHVKPDIIKTNDNLALDLKNENGCVMTDGKESVKVGVEEELISDNKKQSTEF